MKKLGLLFALAVAVATPAYAQLQSGNITGTVLDEQGSVLAGVTVALTSSDRSATFTTGEDGLYRFLALPPGRYTVTASLPGFTKLVREDIEVRVGQNVEIPITLRVAAVEESVTVSGESPIVDTKMMGTATNFTQDELAKVPNSRDPWALLRTVPGVQLDRVNVGGNETGQQSTFVSKGVRRDDAVWTLDGVPITDMATQGGSPTYFDYDAFEEIQISTGGNDIRQATGGVGLNFVVKRGTNDFHGTVRGYFANDAMEGCNLPEELQVVGPLGQAPVTCDTTDHSDQISDYGFDIGGPILRNKLFFWTSWTQQDIRLIRQSGRVLDRTILKTWNAKVNWQATSNDMINFLWFNGDKVKTGRAPGFQQIEPASARYNQGNYYPDNPFHGLWKFENNHTFSPTVFLTSRYAYYGTGFTLESASGLGGQAFHSVVDDYTAGSTNGRYFLRPQHIFNMDAQHFRRAWGASHDFKFGGGYRKVDSFDGTLWPGNMILGREVSRTGVALNDFRARIHREGAGTNRGQYMSFYFGDSLSKDRMTLDVGVRYDRQWGSQLPSSTQANPAFSTLVPGISFDGGDVPFKWSNITPRVGLTYALDESRKTLLRASYARNAGQLLVTTGATGIIGFNNPSASVGWLEFPWVDANNDQFVQPGEIRTDLTLLASGGGLDPLNPTSVRSANQIDPDLKAPVTNGFIIGLDRELMPNLAVMAAYTYGRTTNFSYTPFIGVGPADYQRQPDITGTIPDGGSYSIPLYFPDNAKVTAVGGGRILTNWDGFYTTSHTIEGTITKRMSNRWMMRLAMAYTNPREFYDMETPVNFNGNPTRRDQEPLVNGGATAPLSSGSGSGDVFVNAKWNFNLNGAYQLPWNLEVAGNLYAKQGTPFAPIRSVSVGRDSTQNILLTPELDTERFDSLVNLDLRLAKNLRYGRLQGQLVGDLFNVMNRATEINRSRSIPATGGAGNFTRLTQNLSPRIFRIGIRMGF